MNLSGTPKHKALKKFAELQKTENISPTTSVVPVFLEFLYGLMDGLNLGEEGYHLIAHPQMGRVLVEARATSFVRYDFLATVRIGTQDPPLIITLGVRAPNGSQGPFNLAIRHFSDQKNEPLPDDLCSIAGPDFTPSKDTLDKAAKFIEGCSYAIQQNGTHTMGKTY